MTLFLGLLVFCSAACLDFCHANYVMAVDDLSEVRTAFWSSLQWLAGLVGFVIAVKVTLWVLPAEVAGLALGSVLAIRRRKRTLKARDVPNRSAQHCK